MLWLIPCAVGCRKDKDQATTGTPAGSASAPSSVTSAVQDEPISEAVRARLDALPGPYVVIEHEGAMCAAGGWAMAALG